MAGIGFELRKVISKGGITSFLSATFSGTMIVAGPWLISIISIYLIQNFMSIILPGESLLFTAAIIYAYAFSMLVFGGLHYIAIRILADYLWKKQESSAVSSMFAWCLPQSAVALAAGFLLSLPLKNIVPNPWLFITGFSVLFTAVSMLWLCMLFVSILNQYLLVLLTYAGGMAVSVGLSYVFALTRGTAGALCGYALGQVGVVGFLLAMIVKGRGPVRIRGFYKIIKKYVVKYRMLLVTGLCYSWGIWVDKLIFWYTRGTPILGSFWRLYGPYDLAVYITNLTMIPGLIFFVIASETGFSVGIKKIILSLPKSRFAEIQRKKYGLLKTTRRHLKDQIFLHLAVGAVLLFLLPRLSAAIFGYSLRFDIFAITQAGVIFHLLLFTLINYAFYLEYYVETAAAAMLYAGINFILALVSGLWLPSVPPGISYTAAGLAASLYLWRRFFGKAKTAEQFIFIKSLRPSDEID